RRVRLHARPRPGQTSLAYSWSIFRRSISSQFSFVVAVVTVEGELGLPLHIEVVAPVGRRSVAVVLVRAVRHFVSLSCCGEGAAISVAQPAIRAWQNFVQGIARVHRVGLSGNLE